MHVLNAGCKRPLISWSV